MNQSSNDNLAPYRESAKLLNNALNKACKAGAFTLDEAYLIKISMSNMEKLIELSDTKKDQEQQPIN